MTDSLRHIPQELQAHLLEAISMRMQDRHPPAHTLPAEYALYKQVSLQNPGIYLALKAAQDDLRDQQPPATATT
jgi:hypothetical protein